ALLIADTISVLAHNKKLSSVKTHTIHYGWVVDGNNVRIDQVLFLVMHGPHTFTGDDTVEITCHNNPFIINAIIDAALTAGARIAQQGEFSRRAVLNNKIDLTQAEAINELIHANTQHALKQSLSQLQGSFSNWIHQLEKELLHALALANASFEFLDEENMEFGQQITDIINSITSIIEQLKKTFNQQQQIRQGIRIAIVGSVNTGKSSLFNALLNQERAIVTNIAGTTRDAIEAGLYKNGNYWTLIDTAGLRTTNDVIEQMGIIKSYAEAQKADIILLVFDGSRPLSTDELKVYNTIIDQYEKKLIIIHNKSDLLQKNYSFTNHQIIKTSSISKKNISHVEQAIQDKIAYLFASIDSPFLLNQRHYNALISLEQQLNTI